MEKHIEIIERMMFAMANHTVDGERIFPTLKAAKEALKKQMPKKPYPKDKYNSGYAMHCPTCNNFICLEPDKRSIHPADESNLRCRYCGQALDWSDTE